jgi:hypothetical protein
VSSAAARPGRRRADIAEDGTIDSEDVARDPRPPRRLVHARVRSDIRANSSPGTRAYSRAFRVSNWASEAMQIPAM